MSSYGAKGTRTPNNRLQRTVRYAARRTGAMGYVPDLHKIWVGTSDQQLMALSNERNYLKLAFMQWEDLAYLIGLWGETEPSRLR
jgi:hypothetical protein